MVAYTLILKQTYVNMSLLFKGDGCVKLLWFCGICADSISEICTDTDNIHAISGCDIGQKAL